MESLIIALIIWLLAFVVILASKESEDCDMEEDVFNADFEDYLRNEKAKVDISNEVIPVKRLDEISIKALLDAGIIYIGDDNKIHVVED